MQLLVGTSDFRSERCHFDRGLDYRMLERTAWYLLVLHILLVVKKKYNAIGALRAAGPVPVRT